MAIDFDTDIITAHYAADIVTEAAYAAIPAALRNQTNEQRIISVIELLRAAMETLRDRDEARLLHYCVSRMIAGISYASSYDADNVFVQVVGNVPNPVFAAGDTIDITTPIDNMEFTSTAGGDLAFTVAEINTDLAAVLPAPIDDIEAFVYQGKYLGFRNTTGNEGTAFTLATVTNAEVARKAGIQVGEFVNDIVAVANAARDSAVDFFVNEKRDAVL